MAERRISGGMDKARGARRTTLGACLAVCVLSSAALRGQPSDGAAGEGGLERVFDLEVTELKFPERVARALPENGGWVPVTVQIESASRSARRVTLAGEVRSGREIEFTTRKTIEVPPGASVRPTIYLRVSEGRQDTRTALVRVEVPGAAPLLEARRDLGFVYASQQQVAILLVGGDFGLATPWVGTLDLAAFVDSGRRSSRFNPGSELISESVDVIDAEWLPDSALGYSGFELVLVRDAADADLSVQQEDALLQWVERGGTVILAPENGSGARFEARLARRLLGDHWRPPRIAHDVALGDLHIVPQDGASSDPFKLAQDLSGEEPVTCSIVDPLPPLGEIDEHPRALLSATGEGDDFRRLYVEVGRGAGTVGVLLVDDRALRSARASAYLNSLWEVIVHWHREVATDPLLARALEPVAPRTAEQLRDDSRDIGLPILVGLIAAYVLLVGPSLYFLLKRYNRLLWLIWAEPLLAFVYVGVIFAAGYLSKGVLTKTELVTLISHVDGRRWGVRESFLTIFSADEDAYRIDAPTGQILTPLFANEEERSGQKALSFLSGQRGGASLSGLRLSKWQQGYACSAGFVDFGEGSVEVRAVADEESGEDDGYLVVNHLPYPIAGGVLNAPLGTVELPRLAPGAEARLYVVREEVATPPNGEDPLAEDLSRVQALIRLLGSGGRALLVAVLERETTDFEVDRPHTVKDRVDGFVLFADARTRL